MLNFDDGFVEKNRIRNGFLKVIETIILLGRKENNQKFCKDCTF
jgi:hypothetical protein